MNYAVDNGELFAGRPGEWRKIATPDNVIVGAVAADSSRPGTLYMGAANEMAVYRSTDRGEQLDACAADQRVCGRRHQPGL